MPTETTAQGRKTKKKAGKTDKSRVSGKKSTPAKRGTTSARAGASSTQSDAKKRASKKARSARKVAEKIQPSAVQANLGSLSSWPHLSPALRKLEDDARDSWEHISKNLRGKLVDVDGNIKKKPYAYVIGALGVGIAFATVLL